jgi:hypothetical protein
MFVLMLSLVLTIQRNAYCLICYRGQAARFGRVAAMSDFWQGFCLGFITLPLMSVAGLLAWLRMTAPAFREEP